jgi:hypothetical protein
LKNLSEQIDFFQLLFSNDTNQPLRYEFVHHGQLLEFFKKSLHQTNANFSQNIVVIQSISLFNVFFSSIQSGSYNEKSELQDLSLLLKEVIHKIDERATIENIGVLLKDAFNHCQNKPLFKDMLNNYMFEASQNLSKPKFKIISKKRNILDPKIIEYLLAIECKEKPLIRFENAIGNSFINSDHSFPSPTIIKRFFHLVETNKEIIVIGEDEFSNPLKEQLEQECSVISMSISKIFQTITKAEEFLASFKNLCIFINDIGIHAKLFIEKEMINTFEQYVKFFFFILEK